MHKLIQDVNAYVEEGARYGTDHVLVTLTENKSGESLTSAVVEAYPADVYGNKMEGSSPLVVKDFGADLDAAIEYYNFIEQQLYSGDRINNI